jgi:rhamnosyltransferase
VSAGGIDSVAAVVVTYNPGETFSALMTALRPQVGAIWIVDNGSGDDSLARVRAAAETTDEHLKIRIELITNPDNRGLGAAQNHGIDAALRAGFDWILLMDHDSIPGPDMVETMLAAARDDSDPESIGLLTPIHGDERGLPAAAVYVCGTFHLLCRRTLKPGEIEDRVAFAMASGCLVPARSLRAVGPMAEDFHIDYIDYDFAFRVRRVGYRIVTVEKARLTHRLGDARQARLLGRTIRYREHGAERRHTIYRNRVRVMLRHGLRFPEFIQFELLSVTKDLLQILFLEPGKAEKFRAIVMGIADGLRGRGGLRKI